MLLNCTGCTFLTLAFRSSATGLRADSKCVYRGVATAVNMV
jgi:hypothetical protein